MCVCVHTRVSTHTQMYSCTYVYMLVKKRSLHHMYSLVALHFGFWDRTLTEHRACHLTRLSGQQVSACLSLFRTEITDMLPCLLFMGCWGSELTEFMPSCLYSKHITNWVISPDPRLTFYKISLTTKQTCPLFQSKGIWRRLWQFSDSVHNCLLQSCQPAVSWIKMAFETPEKQTCTTVSEVCHGWGWGLLMFPL